jgi:hypothetical protein
MEVCNLDMIIRRSLLERGLPIHWYAEFLFHDSAAVRELSKDTLQIVNTVNIPINSYGAADLPGDFVDDVMCGIEAGGLLQEIPKKNNINPLRIHDTTSGAFVQHTNQAIDSLSGTYYGFVGAWNWFWNVNDYGEPTGRFFGAPGGVSYGYKIIRERRQIQFVGACNTDNVILMYISNGQHVDNATQIDWRAFRAIQTYSDWQRSPNASNEHSPEAYTYYNAKRLLRANMNDMTVADVRNIVLNSYTASAKN